MSELDLIAVRAAAARDADLNDDAALANLIAWMGRARNVGHSLEEIASASGRTVRETEMILDYVARGGLPGRSGARRERPAGRARRSRGVPADAGRAAARFTGEVPRVLE